jgi:importin-5
VDAALQIFNGLFSYLMDHLVKFKTDLMGIFAKTLQHKSLDINLAALQAVSNFLQIAEGKDAREFVTLLELMAKVALKALEEDEETVLEDALVEFNEMAEIEPKFFRKNFKDLFIAFSPIIAKNDYTNNTIRHQPVEFFVTVVERVPNVVKKDQDTLRALLDLIFKLMIDIDDEIDESWMRPKEGFRVDEDEEEEDSVAFGKTCVDRLVSSIGDEIMLPLLSTLVQNTLANTTDWRYKNAGLMALSQVGEYLDDIQKIAPMVPVIIQHLTHPNPKVRYAALHCIGQMADDMTEEFQENFHEQVLPALTQTLEDPIPRVQAHACAAMTNFFEGTEENIIVNYVGTIMPKLCTLIQVGISIIKENAVTALASLAEASKGQFVQFYDDCLGFLCHYLASFNEPQYK